MNKSTVVYAAISAAMILGGCASTTWNTYPGGTIKLANTAAYGPTARPAG